jgi:hypothetical protein
VVVLWFTHMVQEMDNCVRFVSRIGEIYCCVHCHDILQVATTTTTSTNVKDNAKQAPQKVDNNLSTDIR